MSKALTVKIQTNNIDNLKAIKHRLEDAITRCRKAGFDDWVEQLRPIDEQVHKAWLEETEV